MVLVMPKKWKLPSAGVKYAVYFSDAEARYGLPSNLLARMAYQESRFREDVITGELPSSAGALGIMQIVPRWHPNVDPLDPVASIYYAADFIAKLKSQFGSWEMALAAYNWGSGNLRRKGFEAAPRETRNYVSQISKDIELTA